jgi:hypothetical protein
MRIAEVLTELTFMGHTCTKDCSGHAAGYEYAQAKGLKAPTKTPSKSFDFGTGIAVKANKVKKAPQVQPKPEEEEEITPNSTIPNRTI